MTRKPVWMTVGLGAVLAAASGVTINRVGGSARSQLGWFTLSCVLLVIAGIVARSKSQERQDFRLQAIDSQGGPPKLGEVPLGELGVHWSQISGDDDSTYIRRDVDSTLDEAVSSGQSLVAVSGAPLAGRTRTLAQAARRYAAESWLIRFEAMPGAGLTEMISAARRLAHGGPGVLWLENPDLALLSQLSVGVLDQLPYNLRIFMTVDTNLMNSPVLPRTPSVS